MTPQKIKMTRHDGSDVCPVLDYNADVLMISVSGKLYQLKPHEVRWSTVTAYAVIELVEPDPVIEVGDVVKDEEADEGVVMAVREDEAWVKYAHLGFKSCVLPCSTLTLVRKGGAV